MSREHNNRLMSAKEVIMAKATQQYLVDPVIPRDGIIFMYGKRAIGKTHFGLTLSLCLVNGGVLFGRYPTKPSTVVYVQADTPYPIQRDRIIAAAEYVPVDNLHFYFSKFMNLTRLREDDEFVERVNELEPDLIIWDTLRKIHRSSSNDDDVPSLVYGSAQILFPGTAHMFIHHDKKTVVDQDKLDDEEGFRGSGAWIDDADTGIHIVEPSPGHLLLKWTKLRTCGEQPDIRLTLNTDALLLFSVGNPEPLVTQWRQNHPDGTDDELYQFLMASFACTSRSVGRYAYGG